MSCSIRARKNKGSQFEMDAEFSLQQTYPDLRRTHERGYIMEYDLRSDNAKVAVECKRLKGISWNQLCDFYRKLKDAAPEGYECYVLFQSNHQPCLVFHVDSLWSRASITSFIDTFGTNFMKHPPTKRRKHGQDKKIEEIGQEDKEKEVNGFLPA